ncbi:MAG: 3-phosphoshikimate 1-carboxyvinyltransferase [Bdellovibrionota bacterium]
MPNSRKSISGLSLQSGQRLKFEIICPPDKSLTHRAIIFSSMALGKSLISNPLLGADCLATCAAFRSLGVSIDIRNIEDGNANVRSSIIDIDSPGVQKFHSARNSLDFANSGTTARLLIGLFSSLEGLKVEIIGDESLSKRPMQRVVSPLRRAGAKIDGVDGGNFLPIYIEGMKLKPLAHHVDKASAQVKSALLLAGMQIQGLSSVRLPKGGRDHTERLLKKLGAKCSYEVIENEEIISIEGPFNVPAVNYNVPGDPSSAAFFAVLGAIVSKGEVTIKNMMTNPTRVGFVHALERMGVSVKIIANSDHSFMEETADFSFSAPQSLSSVHIRSEELPSLIDEIPILAVAAMFAYGESCFEGLAELRVKESDRLEETKRLVIQAGGRARIDGDNLYIQGGDIENYGLFEYDPKGDHRLAMAAAVLAKRVGGFAFDRSKNVECVLENSDCVNVSFPNFFEILDLL